MGPSRWAPILVSCALLFGSASAQLPDDDADGVPGGDASSGTYAVQGGPPGPILAISFHVVDAPLWSIDPVTGEGQLVGSAGIARANSLTRDRTGRLYSTGTFVVSSPAVTNDELFSIDPVTLEISFLGKLDFGAADPPDVRALAFSPDNVLYVAQNRPPVCCTGSYELWTVELETRVGTRVGDLIAEGIPVHVQGMAFSPDGTLYGFGQTHGLVIVDTATGEATDVGPPGGGTVLIQTIFFDADGQLFGGGNGLWRIDRETGERVRISDASPISWRGAEFNYGNACTSDAECDDGVYCNGAEQCVSGGCTVGEPPCPDTLCLESEDACSVTPIPLSTNVGIAIMTAMLLALGVWIFGRSPFRI